ncbi:ATP-dependent Lon protease [Fontimonas thermophila]|uniref:Lon protease n=1 Tax=Fontimonas thermophila TaxID=1076937 RepID=A0A1I2KEZ6_9GAMM|nr:endopeptidase La [Fontimonas thermophila]SFF64879.1 ATP-dependent Lon protease [Fontimonas thermophila]
MSERLPLPNHRSAENAGTPPPAGPTSAGAAAADATTTKVPDDALILLPMRNFVLFPGIVAPLTIGRARSIAGAQEAVRTQRPVGIVMQRDPEVEEPTITDLHEIGTIANLLRYITARDGTHHIVVQGTQRFRVLELLEGHPFPLARIERIEEPPATGTEVEAQFHALKQRALEGLQLIPEAPAELAATVQAMESPSQLADFVAGFLDIKPAEKQEVLETIDVLKRLQRLQWMLAHRVEVLRLSQDIGKQTREAMEQRQRQFMLREQLKAIQKELGEQDETEAELAELEKAIAAAGMPEEVEKHARKELNRLRTMASGGSEYAMVRTYLDWLIELPWSKTGAQPVDLHHARAVLDADHYGLTKVKRRILEFLAVQKLKPDGKSPILCLVGPPGVGKTSLGQSIARATGRKFARVALGGTHDEAEIRGHRRTYVGALPGIIIQAIRRAGERDCVMMLDEIDKLGAGGFHGDPSSALLEVLDPEQNASFRDNYLAVPFDLSRVMFIATANQLDTIPGPLLDRMEVIELSGYTESEKLEIARRYLIKRQLEANGLSAAQCQITEPALVTIVRSYTRESGVRNLERQIGAVFRHAAMRIAEGTAQQITVDSGDLTAILGPARYENETAQRTSVPGVATGLAWTPVGGDILFIEASRVPGNGHLVLTGHLGEVMKESAQAALTLVKSRLQSLGVPEGDNLSKSDIHIHVPAGATPKDGPSAGIAIYTALASLLSGRTVKNDVAMTGEISLRGLVLPVGGIKEKVIAAHRAGIRTVILPARNQRDLEEIPDDVRADLHLVWIERVEQALDIALDPSAA